MQRLMLITRIIEIERMYSNGPISQISLFGELLSNAIQSSHQWKKERDLGESTTNCWTEDTPAWLGSKMPFRLRHPPRVAKRFSIFPFNKLDLCMLWVPNGSSRMDAIVNFNILI